MKEPAGLALARPQRDHHVGLAGDTVLEHCHAYVAGKDEEHDHDLLQTAASLNFVSASPLYRKGKPRIALASQKLPFFLVHHQLKKSHLPSLIAAVRGNSSDQVRFAPMILMLNDGPFELMLRFVQLGFDDVIALPERRDLVASRLHGQLDREIIYYRTRDYFGPDRQRLELPKEPDLSPNSADRRHSRYLIVRSAQWGIKVLRREVYGDRGYEAEIEPATFAVPALYEGHVTTASTTK